MSDWQTKPATADEARQFLVEHCPDLGLKVRLIELITSAEDADDTFSLSDHRIHQFLGVGINGVVFFTFRGHWLIEVHIGELRKPLTLALSIMPANLIAALPDIELYLERTRLADRKVRKWAARHDIT